MASKLLAILPMVLMLALTSTIHSSEISRKGRAIYLNKFESICNENDSFNSVFMLRGDTFFRTVEEGKVWRLKSIHSQYIDYPYWKHTEKVEQIEYFLNLFYDESRPVFAFDYQFDYRIEKDQKGDQILCGPSDEYCADHTRNSHSSYVCLYGFPKNLNEIERKTVVASYDGFTLSTMPELNKSEDLLKQQVFKFCDFQQEIIYHHASVKGMKCRYDVLTGWNSVTDFNKTFVTQTTNVSLPISLMNQFYLCVDTNDPKEDKLLYISYNIGVNKIGGTLDFLQYDIWKETVSQLIQARPIAKNKASLLFPISGYLLNVYSCATNPCTPSQLMDSSLIVDTFSGQKFKFSSPKSQLANVTLHNLMACQHIIHKPKLKRIHTSDPSLESESSICNIKEAFDSSFMLGGDTFFKTVSGEIWHMNATQRNPPTKLGEPWKTTVRVESMKKILGEEFKIHRPIFAFDYQYDYRNICSDQSHSGFCGLRQFSEFEHSYSYACVYGQNVYPDKKKTLIVPFAYDTTRYLFEFPTNESRVKTQVFNFCALQMIKFTDGRYNVCQQTNQTGWNSIYQYREQKTESHRGRNDLKFNVTGYVLSQVLICRQLNHTYQAFVSHYRVTDEVDMNDISIIRNRSSLDEPFRHTFTAPYPKWIKLVIPIAFKGIRYRLACAKLPCSSFDELDSKSLEWWHYRSNDPDEYYNLYKYNYPAPSDSLTIQKIMRCPAIIHKEPFEPHNFCKQRSLKSIFTLGEDIYFQGQGKIWRYPNIKSIPEVSTFPNKKTSNILYDSYTTTFLAKHFDLSEIVTGFTAKFPVGCDKYGDPYRYNKTGNCSMVKPEDQHRLHLSCVFGIIYSRYPHVNGNGTLKAMSVMVTPAGIRKYQKSDNKGKETQQHCERILHYIKEMKNEKPEQLFSIVSEKAEFGIYDDQSIIHTLRIHYKKVDSPNLYVALVYYAIGYKSGEHYVDLRPLPDETPFDGGFTHPEMEKNFFYKRDLTKNSLSMKVTLYTINNEEHNEYAYKPTDMFLLFEMFDCKTYSVNSYSLVPIYHPFDVFGCVPKDLPIIKYAYSVFNIGEYVYFQIDQTFYRWGIGDEVGFHYDKQVSDLLNHIFDTTERVLGYSYLYLHDPRYSRITKYRVVLMGRYKWYKYEEYYSPYAGMVYRVFEKDVGNRPLKPVISLRKIQNNNTNFMERPFGVVNNFCDRLDPTKDCGRPSSFLKQLKLQTFHFRTFEAVAYLITNSTSTLNEDNRTDKLLKTFMAVIADRYKLISTVETKHLFEIPIWTYHEDLLSMSQTVPTYIYKWSSDRKNKVYGMFSYLGELFIIATGLNKSLSNKDPGVPLIHKVSYPKDGDSMSLMNWADITKSSEGTVEEFFRCQVKSPIIGKSSASKSRSYKPLMVMFILLLMTFFILFLIIGFIAYQKYGLYKRKSQMKNNNKPEDSKSLSASKRSVAETQPKDPNLKSDS